LSAFQFTIIVGLYRKFVTTPRADARTPMVRFVDLGINRINGIWALVFCASVDPAHRLARLTRPSASQARMSISANIPANFNAKQTRIASIAVKQFTPLTAFWVLLGDKAIQKPRLYLA